MKKNNEREVTAIVKGDSVQGLKSFMDKYPINQTTSMVYFEDGMSQVQSPFTSIVPLSEKIVENDKKVIDIFVRNEKYKGLDTFVCRRRDSIIEQFNARCNFLARSLALNIDTKIRQIITDHSEDEWVMSSIDFIVEIISGKFFTGPANAAFSSTDADSDSVISYAFNSNIIPQLIAVIYDHYDEIIVGVVSRGKMARSRKKENIEEIHMSILNDIIPIFETLKSQLEWMNYMLRSEAATIYRPMGMMEAEQIIEEQYQKECDKRKEDNIDKYIDAVNKAEDRGDKEAVSALIKEAASHGINISAS